MQKPMTSDDAVNYLMGTLFDQPSHAKKALEAAIPYTLVTTLGFNSKRDVIVTAIKARATRIEKNNLDLEGNLCWEDEPELLDNLKKEITLLCKEHKVPYALSTFEARR